MQSLDGEASLDGTELGFGIWLVAFTFGRIR